MFGLRYVQYYSGIVPKEWRGYKGLTVGFVHERINHFENYVNPETGYQTQGGERSWADETVQCFKVSWMSVSRDFHMRKWRLADSVRTGR